MRVYAQQASQEYEQAFRDYVRQAAGTVTVADELARLSDMKDRGVIDDVDFSRLKEVIVVSTEANGAHPKVA